MLEENSGNDESSFNLPSKLYIPLQIFQIQLPFRCQIQLHVAEAIYNTEGGATISVNFDMYYDMTSYEKAWPERTQHNRQINLLA